MPTTTELPVASLIARGMWVFDTRGQRRLPDLADGGWTHVLDLRLGASRRALVQALVASLRYLAAPQDGSLGAQTNASRELRSVAAECGRVLVLVDGAHSIAGLARLLADLGYGACEIRQLFELLELTPADAGLALSA